MRKKAIEPVLESKENVSFSCTTRIVFHVYVILNAWLCRSNSRQGYDITEYLWNDLVEYRWNTILVFRIYKLINLFDWYYYITVSTGYTYYPYMHDVICYCSDCWMDILTNPSCINAFYTEGIVG